MMNIFWEVDNASGCTTCEAHRVPHEVAALERAGYVIKLITPAK